MKIGVVLDQALHGGGGFQQSLNAIQQLKRICPSWASIEIFTSVPANVSHPVLSETPVHLVRQRLWDRMKILALTDASTISNFISSRFKIKSRLEKMMLRRQVDVAYFLGPSSWAATFRKIPFILTVWDLCHRDHPEFPEVSADGEFERRERFYREAINRSYLTLSDSEELSRRIIRRYGVDPERLLVMPFQPARNVLGDSDMDRVDFLSKRSLPDNYLFYPAQFWPHKNHLRILQALTLLKRRGLFYPAVFCGGDKFNKQYVQKTAMSLGIEDQIYFLGFVDDADMMGLYLCSKALVMPTYFGPTNLPPLEAWSLGKPVVYSIACKEQADDAALCVDPDSADELAKAIERVYTDAEEVDRLVSSGRKQLEKIALMRSESELVFVKKLSIFAQRKMCWGAA